MSAAANHAPQRRGLTVDKQFIAGYGLVLLFTALTLGLIIIHGGRLLNLGFPILATALAAVLFVSRRSVYIAFVWWIWLFTPEVRRLVDFQTAYHAVSPVMTTPLLVTTFSAITIFRNPRFLLQLKIIPFSIIIIILLYGWVSGVIQNGVVPATYDFVNWAIPLAFGIFLLLDENRFEENRKAFMYAMLTGLLGTALYGLYQFYHFPPWDNYWLQQSQFASAGLGFAEQVRLFGPLNSPGPYGIALMVPLIFAQAMKGPLKFVSSVFGYPALGLCLVRAAWLGWAVGILYLLLRTTGKARLRMLLAGIIVAICAVPLLTVGPVAAALSARFATFNNITRDGSYIARQHLYQNFTNTALDQPLGVGLGHVGFDSGFLLIPYEFGWVGSLFIVWALATLIFRILQEPIGIPDTVSIAASGIFITMLAENLTGLQFSGVLGMMSWAACALAYQKCLD